MSFQAVRGRFIDREQARGLFKRAYEAVQAHLAAGGAPVRLTIAEETRTSEQNAHFHALCDDIAKSKFPWGGKPRTAAQWKVLLVSGHAIATGEGADMMPGLESEFVNLRESTALMSKRRGSSLIEYTLAFMAMKDIPRRPNLGRA